ncbi:PepSY-associated TM helix domain-containing protein [Methylobacterium sp. NEAU 140]|uniref:PepSY-associated TM helix domain-containing protein n=1 Tax=Methylobacterium sp. NEAU 140 TaxID=3064945 RepID=UPI002735F542|nr:PepSY-associated TM helix domain-containing protein [Methylobacterium sp. NEAU 140]MDP4026646.1 PepSY-associated TM helix domain-containing protein [Methylobacterium sp. NEAU 140]
MAAHTDQVSDAGPVTAAEGRAAAPRFAGSRTFRACLWLHRWTGLVAAPFFLVLCLTGTVLIFHEEIEEWAGWESAVAASNAPLLPLADLTAAALALEPSKRIVSFAFDEDHPERVTVGLAAWGIRTLADAVPMMLDAHSGARLPRPDPRKTPIGILLRLHANWLLGPSGQLFGGVVALLVIVCLVSGVMVYGPYVRDLAFGAIRCGRGQALRQRDLHNLIGVATLGWTLLVSITGIALALGSIGLLAWQATELQRLVRTHATAPAQDGDRAIPISLDKIRTAAEGARPGWRTMMMIYPDTVFSTGRHYTVLLAGPTGLQKRLFEIALVDAHDARVAEVTRLPWYLTLVRISQPLHFGDYGSWPLKILWCGLSWAALFITGNGAWLWWARRRSRRARARSATAV